MRAHGTNRKFLFFVAGTANALLLAVPMVCHAAAAGWKPEQNVEIVIATTAGTGSDATGRLMQRLLTEKKLIEVPAAVVNKPGGAGSLAVNYVNQHAGNGHYFAIVTPALLTSYITGTSKIKYTDTTPLAQIGKESVFFVVRADAPFKTAKDLADRFKADPASISVAFGSAPGNPNHIAAAQVVTSAGANVRNMKAVVFNGSSEARTALLGGHVDVALGSASAVLPQFTAGRVRILAVSAEQRLGGVLSAIPTWREVGIASVSSNWRALVEPQGMREEQIRYWDEVFAKLVQLPEWKQDMEAKLIENIYLNARDTRKLMDTENPEFTTALTELGLATK